MRFVDNRTKQESVEPLQFSNFVEGELFRASFTAADTIPGAIFLKTSESLVRLDCGSVWSEGGSYNPETDEMWDDPTKLEFYNVDRLGNFHDFDFRIDNFGARFVQVRNLPEMPDQLTVEALEAAKARMEESLRFHPGAEKPKVEWRFRSVARPIF